MSAPFDTLQLARGFEAAGFPLDQASKMAEAIAETTVFADLATKADLTTLRTDLRQTEIALRADIRETELRLENQISGILIRVGGMLVVSVALLLTGLGTATGIILNRLPASPISAPAPHAGVDGLDRG